MKSKILLIEDDKDQAEIYQLKFTLEGFDFVVAPNGPDGLIKAEKEKPDLILLDIILFQMDGMEVLKRLKTNPITRRIPVILLTNLDKKDLAEQGKKLGAINFVIKTDIALKDLVKMVKEVLKNFIHKTATNNVACLKNRQNANCVISYKKPPPK